MRLKQSSEQIQANCEFRARLWREFVASYQSVLQRSYEEFSEHCSDFRVRFMEGLTHNSQLRFPKKD